MSDNQSWRTPTVIIGVCTLVASTAGAGLWWAANHFNWCGINDARIAAPPPLPSQPVSSASGGIPRPEIHHVPFGNGLPTVVALHKERGGEALIQQIFFHQLQTKPTPNRPMIVGKKPPIPVIFTESHHDRKSNQFRLAFQNPPGVVEEWTTLEISIVNPHEVGTTYLGNVTVTYSGGKQQMVDGVVEVDVVATRPDPHKD